MKKAETTKKFKIPTKNVVKEEILNGKYTKIAIGALGFIVTLVALGGMFKVVNYTVENYKKLKATINS